RRLRAGRERRRARASRVGCAPAESTLRTRPPGRGRRGGAPSASLRDMTDRPTADAHELLELSLPFGEHAQLLRIAAAAGDAGASPRSPPAGPTPRPPRAPCTTAG